jgi:uncharacterized membrane protein YeaQ/YmgE (transglycosylase-associated protein family)
MEWNLATRTRVFCMLGCELTLRLFGGDPSSKLSARNFFRSHLLPAHQGSDEMSIIWTIIIGFIAGIIAKFLHPGPNEPSGFVLTTILGIVGAFVATFLGQALGWYRPDQGAGLIGAVVGAVVVLVVWSIFARRNTTAI